MCVDANEWNDGPVDFFFNFRMKSACPEYYVGPGQLTGHEKEGPRPWPEFIRGSPNNWSVFLLFLPSNRLNFRFPSPELDPLHILKQYTDKRRGTSITWRSSDKRQTESSGRRKKRNGISQSPFRRCFYGLAQRHPDTHPLYIYRCLGTVNKLCICIGICVYILHPCVWCIQVYVYVQHTHVCGVHRCTCVYIHVSVYTYTFTYIDVFVYVCTGEVHMYDDLII